LPSGRAPQPIRGARGGAIVSATHTLASAARMIAIRHSFVRTEFVRKGMQEL
jgi:hypothetical protein